MSSKEHGVGGRSFQKEADKNPRLSRSQQPMEKKSRGMGLMFLVTFNKGRSMNMKDHRQGQC